MKFLLDQDVPETIARVLRRAGHEASPVREALRPDATDDEVLDLSVRKSWILVTCNRDDYVRPARERTHPGMVIVIRRRTRAAECAALLTLLRGAGEEGLDGTVNFA